jgi:hypothetical protein
VEALARSERSKEVKARLADALERGREGLLTDFGDQGGMDRERVRSIGSLYQALLTGLGVQWLVDPRRAPGARQIVAALAEVGAPLAGRPASRRRARR